MKKLLLIIIAFLHVSVGYSDDIPPEVKRLKLLRDKKVEKEIKEIDAVYYRELEKLKKKYAAQGNYTAAAYVEKMQLAFTDSEAPEKEILGTKQQEAGQLANVYCKAPFVRFKNDVKINETVPSFNYVDVPEKYEGWKISAITTSPTEPLTFKVKKSGTVSLLMRPQSVPIFKSKGWIAVEKAKLNGGPELIILEKTLGIGEYSMEETVETMVGIRLLKK